MEEKTVHVPGISCGHCVMTIEREVGEIPGVESVEGNQALKRVTVRWSEPATWETVQETLAELGFPPAG
jgi:copper ion binding protein